ncbi:MAG TPA: class I SAM-dependent methyltransferase, partial [Nitrospiraceae bacterium]
SGHIYPIRNGVPRFAEDVAGAEAVSSFGDEWNHFNFDLFRLNWMNHTVANTFGSPDVFKDKVVVDAGGGSGMQSRWMSECGATRVICLELSHAVDGIIKANLNGLGNIDVVQCSIDAPPLKDSSISGIVICHNVIQHTPSVEKTARELWRVVSRGGELAFNCYMKYPSSLPWMMRFHVYRTLRRFLAARSFRTRLAYAKTMALLRFVPALGWCLEKGLLMVRGDIPDGPDRIRRMYKAGMLNTFDWYGGHRYQHHKTEQELRGLVSTLQPDSSKVMNLDRYFTRPPMIGCAIRIMK